MMRVKEIAVGDTAVALRSCQRGAAQHQLIDHELAVVLAKRTFDGAVSRVGAVGAACPLPGDAECIIELARTCRYLPFRFGRQMLAAPARERVRLVVADMTDRRVKIDRLQAAEGHDLPFPIDLAPVPG